MANPFDQTLDDLLGEGQAPPSNEDQNEFDEVLDGLMQTDQMRMRNAAKEAANTTPEAAAEIDSLATKSGLPPDMVERNKDRIKAEVEASKHDYAELAEKFPVLADHFKDYAFAKIAKDDMERLPFWEQITRAFSDIPEKYSHGEDTNRTGELSYLEMTGRLDEAGRGELEEIDARTTERASDPNYGIFHETISNTAELAGQFVEPGIEAFKYGLGGAIVGGKSAAIAGQLGPQAAFPEEVITVPAATAAGFGVGATWYMSQHAYRIEAGHAWKEFKEIRDDEGNPLDPTAMRAAAHIVGSINSGLEVTGLAIIGKAFGVRRLTKSLLREETKKLFKNKTFNTAFTNFAKRYATAWAGEVSTEVMQEGTNIIASAVLREAAKAEGRTFEEFEARQLEVSERLGEIFRKVGLGMIIPAGLGASVNLVADARAAHKATQTQSLFEAIGQNAAETKMRELAPQRYRDFVANATKDGAIEDLYIDVKAFNTFFQGQGIDPRQAAAEIPGVAEQYDEAYALGGDLKIKTADYAATIAGTDYHQGLTRHLRLNPEDMSMAEAERYASGYNEQVQAEAEQIVAEQEKALRQEEPVTQFYNQLRRQLSNAGQSPSAAATNASLTAAMFRVEAQRSGREAADLINQWKVRVAREFPEALREVDRTDLLIDALRSRKFISPKQIYGPSLGEMLAERGGVIDEGGELSARDLQRERIGRRRLVNDSGMSLDAAAGLATEAGYAIPEGVESHDVLLEALEREAAGDPMYAVQNINQALFDRERSLDELSDYLERIGLNVEDASNREVKDALERGYVEDQIDTSTLRVLYQGEADEHTTTTDTEVIDRPEDVTGASGEGRAVTGEAVGPDAQEIAIESSAAGLTLEELNDPEMVALAQRLWRDMGTESPVFRKWFRESTMAVDRDPMAMYYGTDEIITNFSEQRPIFEATTPAGALGYLFTNSLPAARRYGQHTMAGYLRLENPAVLNEEQWIEFINALPTTEAALQERQNLIDRGHDGIFITGLNQAVMFHVEQYKRRSNRGEQVEEGVIEYRGRQISRETLEDIISSDTAMDAYWGDYYTGQALEEDGATMLPDGIPMSICTNCARRVIEMMGRGEVYGFSNEDQQVAVTDDYYHGGGHDFALIDGHWIVDPWLKAYTGHEQQGVYDLNDPADAENIKRLYGDPAKWSVLRDDGFVKPEVAPGEGKVYYQRDYAQRNDIGLYSGVEQAIIDLPLPGWKAKPKQIMTDAERARLEGLRAGPPLTEGTEQAQEIRALISKEMQEEPRALGKDIWTKLIKTPGVKKEELEWLGLEEYLQVGDSRQMLLPGTDPRFTRQEVVDYVRQNGVVVEETFADEEATETEFDWTETVDDDSSNWEGRVEDYMYDYDRADITDDRYFYFWNWTEKLEENIDEIKSQYRDALPEDKQAEIDEIDDIWELRDFISGGQYNFDADVLQAFREAFEEAANQAAEEEYFSEPYRMWWDERTGYRIHGNDDVGYSLNGSYIDVYSFNEAEIRAYEELRDSYDFVDEESATAHRWSEYVMDGSTYHYAEQKLILPDIDPKGAEREFYETAHFPDANIVAFIRQTRRPLTEPVDLRRQFTRDESLEDAGYEIINAEEATARQETGEQIYLAVPKLSDPDIIEIIPAGRVGSPEFFEQGVFAGRMEGQIVRVAKQPVRHSSVYFIDEMQSDWHQQGRQEGYQLGLDVAELDQEYVNAQEEIYDYHRHLFDKLKTIPLRDKLSVQPVNVATPGQDENIMYFVAHEDDINAYPHKYPTPEEAETALEGIARVSDPKYLVDFHDGSPPIEMNQNEFVQGMREALENNFAATTEEAVYMHGWTYAIAGWVQKRPEIMAQLNKQWKNLDVLRNRLRAERSGVVDAPFKADAWMSLALKRALISAAEDNVDSFAWVDSNELVRRWSPRYERLYQNQYDKKMPSLVKKLTNQTPRHVQNADARQSYWIIDMTPELKEKIKAEGFTLFQKEPEGPPRGAIGFGDETIIRLFDSADMSTFLHESGHLFLEVLKDLATTEGASNQIRSDYDLARRYLELQPGQEITDEHHERFARAFEAYLFEGKAPSVELQPIFQRFRAWLLNVYRSIRNLDVELTDEIRGVFDRMLATDDEIAAAQAQLQATPMFENAQQMGVTQEEFQAYMASADRVTQEATRELERKVVNEVMREARSWWKSQWDNMREDVEAEIGTKPAYQAIRHFNGDLVLQGMERMQLSKQALVDMFDGPEILSYLRAHGVARRSLYTSKGGVHPDQVADLFGFASGDELVQAIANAPKFKEAVDQETTSRMRERHGDMLSDGIMSEEAIEALHSDQRGVFLETELKALSARTNRPGLPATMARNIAEAVIGRKPVKEATRAGQYQMAEVRAAKAAEKAMLRGDMVEASNQKRMQLINYFLYRQARQISEEVDKVLRYLGKFSKPGTRKNLARDYMDQIDEMLAPFDLRRSVTLKELARRKSLSAWVAERIENGEEVVIDPEQIERAKLQHYKDMPVDDFLALRDAIKNVEHLARLKQNLLREKGKREFNETVEIIVDNIREKNKWKPTDPEFDQTAIDSAREWGRLFGAELTKMEFLFHQLDGNEFGGPAWEAMFRPLADAEQAELAYHEKIIPKLNKAFGRYTKRERAEIFLDRKALPPRKYFIKEMNKSYSKASLIAMGLNWGNNGNRQALMNGYGWNQVQVEAALNLLSEKDWLVIRDIWDTIDTMWPDIAALEKELSGVVPEKVQPEMVDTKYGSFRGGYYPLRYDSKISHDVFVNEEKENSADLFETNWMRPNTRKGHTYERQKNVKRPVKLDMSVLGEHVNNVIHDLTHRRAIMDVDRLARDPRIREVIENTAGRELYREIRPWLQAIARDRKQLDTVLERVINHFRIGATIVNMGLKVSTAIVQPLGFFNSVEVLGEKYSLLGLRKFYGNPMKVRRQVNFIYDKSVMMRNRSKTWDRDVRDTLKRYSRGDWQYAFHQNMLRHIGFADLMVSMPTWIGAYQQGIDQGMNDADAIAHADSLVRMTQSAGGVKDLAAIQRGGEFKRMLTMFYSYFNVLYNQMRRRKQITASKHNYARAISGFLYLVIFPAFLSEYILGRGPEDDEEYWKWALKITGGYTAGSMAGVRDVAQALISDYGYGMTPVSDAMGATVAGLKSTGEIFSEPDEMDRNDAKRIWLATGYLFHLPARQTWIMMDELLDTSEGYDFSWHEFLVTKDYEEN